MYGDQTCIGWRNHRSVDIYRYTYLYQFICLRVSGRVVYLELEFYLFVSHGGMNYRGSTCKFRNARSAFRNLHVDPLSFISP